MFAELPLNNGAAAGSYGAGVREKRLLVEEWPNASSNGTTCNQLNGAAMIICKYEWMEGNMHVRDNMGRVSVCQCVDE